MIRRPAALVVLAALLAAPEIGAASCGLALEATGDSRIRLEGSTNVHRWSCDGEGLEARMELDAPLAQIHALLAAVEKQVEAGPIPAHLDLPQIEPPTFRLVIPVGNLDCGKRAMERDLREAMTAETHPTIEYRFLALQAARLEPAREGENRRYELEVIGTLELAGVLRRIESTAWAEAWGDEAFRLEGELHLRMTQFDITPPTALLGIIRARDELVVHYDLFLETTARHDTRLYTGSGETREKKPTLAMDP